MKLYFETLKTNIMLVIVSVILLILTFGFWFGLPVFGLNEFFYGNDLLILFQFVFVCFSVGVFFSLYFIPLHIFYAKQSVTKKQESMIKIFFKSQSVVITLASLAFALFYAIVLYVSN